jgi:hypothetical protein
MGITPIRRSGPEHAYSNMLVTAKSRGNNLHDRHSRAICSPNFRFSPLI